MDAVFEIAFAYDADKDALSLTRVLPDGTRDTGPVDMIAVRELEKRCRDLAWNRSPQAMAEVGVRLFDVLNSDGQWLVRALQEADARGACLRLDCRLAGPTVDLPFEALWRESFFAPERGVHMVRRVSDWGSKANPQAKGRALRMLFMACSPEGLSPVLDFEKEEETIYDVTKGLAIDIEVEDTGSLEGLGEQLANNEYDVVHLSGHADINKDGVPFFWMEDEEGMPVRITPAQLWEKLSLSPPRLVFLSGCRTAETAGQAAAVSFAQRLVANHSSTVLGWGLPVSDAGAMAAAERLYFDLSRGEDILSATLATRKRLFEEHQRDWPLLRLFSDGTPLEVPLVRKGQKKHVRPRDLQYRYLLGSQVKVLTRGFVGRRRQIQRGLRCLRKDEEKVGLLLHGTGGLGKSCLAGKLCERLKDHTLIVVHGWLADTTIHAALKDAFFRADDQRGLQILDEKREMPERIRMLCSSCFQQRNYLILLDDFEQNLDHIETGNPVLKAEAVAIVEGLLRYLSYSGKMTQLIITSRYGFALTVAGEDLVEKGLESIGLTSFRGADERKKVGDLTQIAEYPDANVKKRLIAAGRGNPRLMEVIDTLVAEVKGLDVAGLLETVKDEQDEFVQELVLSRILESQPVPFRHFVQRASVYRQPVLERGIGLVCEDMEDWREHLDRGVRLSLVECDSRRNDCILYWATPLLREEAFGSLDAKDRTTCHRAAARYYRGIQLEAQQYNAVAAMELIEHALQGGLEDDALQEAGPLLAHLRESLAYRDAKSFGLSFLQRVSEQPGKLHLVRFLFEIGWAYQDLGEMQEAIRLYERALAMDEQIPGDKRFQTAGILNNLGSAWREIGEFQTALSFCDRALSAAEGIDDERRHLTGCIMVNIASIWKDLGQPRKALELYERALVILKGAYGDVHPRVSDVLNNMGDAWKALGDLPQAIECYVHSLTIDREVLGRTHPDVAVRLNNLGLAWRTLGQPRKAIAYYEEVMAILREVYGETHIHVAGCFNNLAVAWEELGEYGKAIRCYEQAIEITKTVAGDRDPRLASLLTNIGQLWMQLEPEKAVKLHEQGLAIDKAVYGDNHPAVAIDLNNLGTAWCAMGEPKKAIAYIEQALAIDRTAYGDNHPSVATYLNNLGTAWLDLGEKAKARKCFEEAYAIFLRVYGAEHPHTKTVKELLDSVGGVQ